MGRIPIAREGWPFIAVPAAAAAWLALAGRRRLAAPAALAAGAAAWFFRDPERPVPEVTHEVLAPADGTVREVVDDTDEWVGPAVRVSIFLSPLDVHVNRSPISGLVVETLYFPGRFVPAWRSEASRVNERCVIRLAGATARVTVVQIAGVVARRIVCRVGAGDKLVAGERFGMIRFGSRTDCYLPRSAAVRAAPGDRVRAGVSVLGVLPA